MKGLEEKRKSVALCYLRTKWVGSNYMELGKMVNGKITSLGVSVPPWKDDKTKRLKCKAQPIQSRQQEGMFHSRDHKPRGSFCRDSADA